MDKNNKKNKTTLGIITNRAYINFVKNGGIVVGKNTYGRLNVNYTGAKEEKLIIHPKRPKGDDGYKTFSVRIREDIVQRIDEISAQTGRSRNELIGILLEFSLDRCSIEPK